MSGTSPTLAWWFWIPLILIACYALGWLTAFVGSYLTLRPYERARDVGWVEKARLAWPARQIVSVNAVFLPAVTGAALAFGPAAALGFPARPLAVVAGTAVYLGVRNVSRRNERRLLPWFQGRREGESPGLFLGDLLVSPTMLTLALLTMLMPDRWGPWAWAVLGVGLALQTFSILGGWVAVFHALGYGRRPPDRLASIVDQSSSQVGVRPRSVCVLASPHANALVWTAPKVLVYTTRCLESLDDAELQAVTLHELGHLTESWPVLLARVVTVYGLVAVPAFFPLVGSFGLSIGLAPVLAWFLLAFGLKALARRMEFRADRLATEAQGGSRSYGTALEKIHEANLVPAVMRTKRAVHPHLYDRMVAAGATPDYARPEPPASLRVVEWTPLFLAMTLVTTLAIMTSRSSADRQDASGGWAAGQAVEAMTAGRPDEALEWYRVAQGRDPWNPLYPLERAHILLDRSRLAEAEAAGDRCELLLQAQDTRDAVLSARLSQFRENFRAKSDDSADGREP